MKFLQAFIFIGFLLVSTVPAQNPLPSVSALLKKLEREDDFSGVVLIAKDSKPIFKRAYGFANRPDGIRNKTFTRFNLASMNKMFTGVAIMQLVEAGKLSLEDTVDKILPNYPRKDIIGAVTVRQLLTHTSGMGNFWEEHSKAPKEKFKTVEDYVPLFASQPLQSPPGAKYSYSNSGYMVLGLIIEKISGKTYFDYVRENIFRPAGMLDTESLELESLPPDTAHGYTMSLENPGRWIDNIYTNVAKGTPSGGGFSTADDLLKFARALMSFKLLNRENTQLCITGKIKYDRGMYGFGFSEDTVNGHRIFGHTGGSYGIANETMIYEDLGYTVIILTNGEVENYWETSNFIRRQLVGSTPAIDNYFFTDRVADVVVKAGYDAAIKEIADNAGNHALRESLIERKGFRALFTKNDRAAIDLFKLNTSSFPDSSQAVYNLAEAYRVTGNIDLAVEAYRRYLKMEPTDSDAEAKLKKLENKR